MRSNSPKCDGKYWSDLLYIYKCTCELYYSLDAVNTFSCFINYLYEVPSILFNELNLYKHLQLSTTYHHTFLNFFWIFCSFVILYVCMYFQSTTVATIYFIKLWEDTQKFLTWNIQSSTYFPYESHNFCVKKSCPKILFYFFKQCCADT